MQIINLSKTYENNTVVTIIHDGIVICLLVSYIVFTIILRLHECLLTELLYVCTRLVFKISSYI